MTATVFKSEREVAAESRVSRWQIDIPKDREAQLEGLMLALGIVQKKDLFNNAVTLLEWAVEEIEEGRIIASVDEANEKYRELTMPVFSKPKARQAKRSRVAA